VREAHLHHFDGDRCAVREATLRAALRAVIRLIECQ